MQYRQPDNDTVDRLGGQEDGLQTFLLAGNSIRGSFIEATRMVNQMRWNHDLGILETLVLGHAYMGASLMTTT